MESVRKLSRPSGTINEKLSKRYPDGSALLIYDSGAISLIGKRTRYLSNSSTLLLHCDDSESKACLSCQNLCTRYQSDSPNDRGEVMKIAFQDVQNGPLREADLPKQGSMSSYSQRAHGTPWDKVVSFGFLCRTCGGSLHFHIETHHSSSG